MSLDDDKLKFAGEVKVDKITIFTPSGFSQEVTAQVQAISIYESIHKPFIDGNVIIKESLDFANLFPLTGQEFIRLELRTPGMGDYGKVDATYMLYKMTDREILGDKSVAYQLHFMSLEGLVGLNKKISKLYTGNIGDMVQDILTDREDGLETEKRVTIEPVVKQHQYVSNFWTPVENLQYLTMQAVNKDNAPYMLFENRDGFNFVTLEAMYDQGEAYQTFSKDNYTRDELGSGADAKNPGEDYKRILDMNIEVGYDYITRLKSGFFGSRQYSYDLFTKKYTVKDFNIFEEFQNNTLKTLNPYPAMPSGGVNRNAAAQMTYIKISNIFSDFTEYDGDTSNYDRIQRRKALLAMAQTNVLNITVPGRVDYTAGMKVEVTLPLISPLNPEDTDYFDKRWSGYYIIASINHHINKEQHECSMELISDSLQMSAEDGSDEARSGLDEAATEDAARSGVQ